MRQLAGSPKPLALAAGAAGLLSLMPGLPFLPLHRDRGGRRAAAPGSAIACRWVRSSSRSRRRWWPSPNAEAPLAEQMRVDMLRVELGYGLLGLAGGDQPRLPEQIKSLRRSIATEMGFVLPAVRIQDNMQLPPETYVVPHQGDRGGPRRKCAPRAC